MNTAANEALQAAAANVSVLGNCLCIKDWATRLWDITTPDGGYDRGSTQKETEAVCLAWFKAHALEGKKNIGVIVFQTETRTRRKTIVIE